MQTSRFLARLLGPFIAIVGLGILLNPSGTMTLMSRMISDPGLIYFAVMVELLAGIALLLVHNVWIADWRVLITLTGWLAVIEATAWILAPERMQALYTPMLGSPGFAIAAAVIALIIGAVLLYYGYFEQPARAGANTAGANRRRKKT